MRFGLVIMGLVVLPAGGGAQQRWMLVEEVRIGGGDAGPTSFADVRGIATNAKGWIFVLDHSTQDIRVFDAAGRHVKTAGRTGSGPGEMRQANGMIRAPDGTLWLNDPPNARFTVFDSEGAFLRHHTAPNTGYGFMWFGFFDPSGRLVDPIYYRREANDRRPVFRMFSRDMSSADTVWALDCGVARATPEPWIFRTDGRTTYMQIPFAAGSVSALDFPVAQWCGWSSEYRLRKRALPDGNEIGSLQGTVPGPAVTDRERDSIRADLATKYPGARPDLSAIPAHKPIIRRVFVDDRHRVWVMVNVPGPGSRFDVFDATGRPLATLETPIRMTPYHPILIEGEKLYAVILDQDDVPMVIRGRIEIRR